MVSRSLPTYREISVEQRTAIAEVCSKSSVVWLRPEDDERRQIAWHVWHNDALHVVYGEGEQQLPMITGLVEVAVPSKSNGATVVLFVADAQILPPGSAAWAESAEQLSTARLNATDPEQQRKRWSQSCLISTLTPRLVLEIGAGYDQSPTASVTPRREATTTWRPWHLRGRNSRRRGTSLSP